MCGRYTVHTSMQVVADHFQAASVSQFAPRYNVAPSQDVPVVRLGEGKQREIVPMRWGLVPFWAKDPKISYKLINARSETAHEKPAFRQAYRMRRCLIPADGFFEWRKDSGAKQPFYIFLKDRSVFAFAGLWEYWKDAATGNEITSCTILTTQPNEFVAKIHDRMPVILQEESYAAWMNSEQVKPEVLAPLLKPIASSLMNAHAVTSHVNSPKNDNPDCMAPVVDEGTYSKLVVRKL